MKTVKWLLLALGLWILFTTVQKVGLGTLADQLVALNWRLWPIAVIYPFVFALNTLGWSYAYPQNLPEHVPFSSLYRVRIIGEAFNCVIPLAASLGGEPVKAELLKSKHGIALEDSYASILIVHTTFWISLNLFVLGALGASLGRVSLSPVLWRSLAVFLCVLGFVSVFLIIGLHFGIFKHVHGMGENFKWWGRQSEERKMKFLKLDESIKRFYTSNPRRFILSSLFNFLAWCVGVAEVYWLSRLLGLGIGWREAWLFEALIQVLRIITFFVPSGIGTQEGGIVLIFMQFGLTSAAGLAFALIRRMREILWIGVGLFLWFLTEDRPSLKAAAVEETA